jgi:FAD/FMN-containing dehydrogenase/Fe-S oxidoreductase
MIPRIAEAATTQSLYLDFIERLHQQGFGGEASPDYASRVVQSTDNGIYQVLPQGVLYPKTVDDLILIAQASNEARFAGIRLSPRGGGTAINGQSLTDGLVVDTSKHMNRILEINAEERWVRVQGGVVKDQLNAALKPYGLFFAPEVSSSSRATIGGMINTDASGQGSCLYGKTRDHVLALRSVWMDGSCWDSGVLDEDALARIKTRDDRIGEAHRLLDEIYCTRRNDIDAKFPKLNRCLTGYDLAHIRGDDGRFNLNAVLCGAEGSLAFIAEATLNLMPTPKYAALINIKYDSFESSLRDAKALTAWAPASIETIDSKVLNLAMGDIVWDAVQQYFPHDAGEPEIQGINLVEYTADDEAQLRADVDRFCAHLAQASGAPGKNFGHTVVYGATEINKIWAMRKKAVGLLGNAKGEKRPIPFVEDTAVPPENLADFIMEFRAVLDQRGLDYGMFGHVDAGVLHVRPVLDLKDASQEKLLREITDEVVQLTRKYKGLLWGEHGKGMRSEYAPEFFGDLYPELQRIKAVFDPLNQLNPGKIATPMIDDAELFRIDEVPTRGQHDRQVGPEMRAAYGSAMNCNGNGACFNYDPNDAMCPSWKATRERIHSPKGRASLIREWLRLMASQGTDLLAESARLKQGAFLRAWPGRLRNTLARRRGDYDFSNEVHDAMMGCLACKSCVTQCPVKVNVPDFRARFLELYYGRYLRPLKHYFVGSLEHLIPLLARFPAPYNWAMGNPLIQRFFRNQVGLVDSPAISKEGLLPGLRARGIALARPDTLAALPEAQRTRSVIIVQDAFTSYFETRLVLDLIDLLGELGFHVLVAPFRPNGKPLHVHGFMAAFGKAARRNARMLNSLAAYGVPLVGIDPSMTLTYRQEYGYALPEEEELPQVQLIQDWLATQKEVLEARAPQMPQGHFSLLAHCTEKTSAAPSLRRWQSLFEALGQTLDILPVGCCGMSGTYGHETAHYETSQRIYDLSWRKPVNDAAHEGRLVATGYSCRSQVKRFDGQQLPHPVQVLLQQLRQRQMH